MTTKGVYLIVFLLLGIAWMLFRVYRPIIKMRDANNMRDIGGVWTLTRTVEGVYKSVHTPNMFLPKDTIGDGNCFFHAILGAVDAKYQYAKSAKDIRTITSMVRDARQRLVDTYDFRKEDLYRYWIKEDITLNQNIIVPYINEQLLEGCKFEDLFPRGFRPQHEDDVRKLNDGIASYMSRDGSWISYGMVKNNVAESYGVNLSLLISTPQELKLFKDIAEYHSQYEDKRPCVFLNRKGDHFESVLVILENKTSVYKWTRGDIPFLAEWLDSRVAI